MMMTKPTSRTAAQAPALHSLQKVQSVQRLTAQKPHSMCIRGASVVPRAGGRYLNSHQAENVVQVHSQEELDKLVTGKMEGLVVLECTAKSCRPCRAFAGRYVKIATAHPEATFAQITGDESMETRGMMMKMQVKSTPTFLMYANGQLAHMMTGANKEKLTAAIMDHSPQEYDSSMTEGMIHEGGLQLQMQGA